MKPITIVGVILIVAVLLYLWMPHKEGFETAPAPTQKTDGQITAGAGTTDTGGATTVDPTQSLPQPRDVLALQESYKNFYELATAKDPSLTDLDPTLTQMMIKLRDEKDNFNNDLQILLANPAQLGHTNQQINEVRNLVEAFIEKLRAANVIGITQGSNTAVQKDAAYAEQVANQPAPTTQAGVPGTLTLDNMRNLKSRIEAEVKRLQDLRSQAASVTSRVNHLTQLAADLGDMISRIERNEMKLEDVPITPEAAEKFLENLRSNTDPVPPLVSSAGAVPAMMKMETPAAQIAPTIDGAAVGELMALSRNLKWSLDVRLEHDPTLEHKERMIQQLGLIMKQLTNLSVSGAAIPADSYNVLLAELRAIQQSLSAAGVSPSGPEFGNLSRLGTAYAREPTATAVPDHLQVAAASGAALDGATGTCEPAAFPTPGDSRDSSVRPGFVMNDEQIARRASAASYSGEGVGGADYKERALNLCRQIKEGALGDVASFGCIANPAEVGPTYSWKGNFHMICNRLGDSWGRKYPEQFGCPPYDPTAKFSSGMEP
jgi:hypothetical protein